MTGNQWKRRLNDDLGTVITAPAMARPHTGFSVIAVSDSKDYL